MKYAVVLSTVCSA